MTLKIAAPLAAAVLLLSLSPVAASETDKSSPKPREHGGPQKKEGKGGSTETESFAVVQIGSDVRIVRQARLAALQQRLEDDYQSQLQSYEEARKAAARNKQKFEGKKPVKEAFKVLGKDLKSEEEARALREGTLAKLKGSTQAKNGTYAVVQVGNKARVVKSSEVQSLMKELGAAHDKAVKEYEAAKKEALRKKEKFDGKPPVKQEVKVLHKSVKSEEEARALCEEATAKLRKNGSEAGEKNGARKTGKSGE
jgi:hypothetical protein